MAPEPGIVDRPRAADVENEVGPEAPRVDHRPGRAHREPPQGRLGHQVNGARVHVRHGRLTDQFDGLAEDRAERAVDLWGVAAHHAAAGEADAQGGVLVRGTERQQAVDALEAPRGLAAARNYPAAVRTATHHTPRVHRPAAIASRART